MSEGFQPPPLPPSTQQDATAVKVTFLRRLSCHQLFSVFCRRVPSGPPDDTMKLEMATGRTFSRACGPAACADSAPASCGVLAGGPGRPALAQRSEAPGVCRCLMVRFHAIIPSHGTGNSGNRASPCVRFGLCTRFKLLFPPGPAAHRLIALPCCCRWKCIPNDVRSSVMKSRQLNL